LTDSELLGKQIFYNASDPRMSQDGYLSCAVCHINGGHDGQTWDFTDRGEGLRNTPTLLGKSGMLHGNLNWTANLDEIQDFENEIRLKFLGRGFMTDNDFARTKNPLGLPKIGISSSLDSLSSFVHSLNNPPRSPNRKPDGTLSEEAEKGRQIFSALRCQGCHSGKQFTDRLRHDIGSQISGSGKGHGKSLKGIGFETPGLKGLWNTSPYLHHGKATTLEQVLREFNHPNSKSLSNIEISHLIAFLKSIDQYEPEVQLQSSADYDQDGVFDQHDCAPLNKQLSKCEF